MSASGGDKRSTCFGLDCCCLCSRENWLQQLWWCQFHSQKCQVSPVSRAAVAYCGKHWSNLKINNKLMSQKDSLGTGRFNENSPGYFKTPKPIAQNNYRHETSFYLSNFRSRAARIQEYLLSKSRLTFLNKTFQRVSSIWTTAFRQCSGRLVEVP